MRLWVGALISRGSLILLGKRSTTRGFLPDRWDLFGGHVENDETPDEALRRELAEELGIVPTEFITCEVLQGSLPGAGEFEYWIYRVKEWAGAIANRSDEHSTIRWFTLSQTRDLCLAHEAYYSLFERHLNRG